MSFETIPPYIGKINKYANYYRKHGRFDKPITVIAFTNENNEPNELLLVDGYARYEVASLFKFKRIPVRYQDISEYIEINYGMDFPFEIINPSEQVYIADYSISTNEMRRLLTITNDVTWIDHHKTTIAKYGGFGSTSKATK